MHLQFPLAQQVRHRRIALREFAARAAPILGARDDCRLDASDAALALLARNEEALALPRQILQQVFGADIEFEPVRVRLAGTPPHEPIMHVRIDAPLPSLPKVRRALQQRRIVLLEQDIVRTRAILRGEGLAARLLGLGDELSTPGGASILLWVALSRYAPVVQEGGAGDGNRTHV